MSKIRNIAYIDGQNMYMSTKNADIPWTIDLTKLRTYLRHKYHVDEAYYFVGAYDENRSDLYLAIQRAGFIVQFRLHGINMKSNKKGNVDVDIAFSIMRDLYERGDEYEKIILLSNDGDFFRVVDYMKSIGKLETVLLPNRRYASSLYKRLDRSHFAYIDSQDMRDKLEHKKRTDS